MELQNIHSCSLHWYVECDSWSSHLSHLPGLQPLFLRGDVRNYNNFHIILATETETETLATTDQVPLSILLATMTETETLATTDQGPLSIPYYFQNYVLTDCYFIIIFFGLGMFMGNGLQSLFSGLRFRFNNTRYYLQESQHFDLNWICFIKVLHIKQLLILLVVLC